VVLIPLMLLGAAAFVARFAYGLGATTNLSDNYPWGLWIVFDLVWIALAAGAFVTAGIVHIFHAERFHMLARPAVWLGFLSYSLVVVTLLADLGLPWHFWQLGVQRPEHSAMYEVAWCIALYVIVLALEFLPAVFEKFGWERLQETWRNLSPICAAIALSFFVYLMSHKPWLGLVALACFAVLVYLTRGSAKDSGVPVMLVIAAVAFSTMHQSSLGSLFLLMPDKLSHLWWSPIMPLLFLISSVASGLALVMLVDTAISFSFHRPRDGNTLASLGKVLWGVLAVYLAVRMGELVFNGNLHLLAGERGGLFLLEVVAGGLGPLVLLSTGPMRNKPGLLTLGACLTIFGVAMNRLNVVLLGMELPGTMPGGSVGVYFPSLIEWAIAISLVAAAIFFFASGIKLLPILPRIDSRGHAGAASPDGSRRRS
jgi:formate dehydrogenase iron-sulfur subunit